MDCDRIRFNNIEENPILFQKNQIWVACDGLTNEEVKSLKNINIFLFFFCLAFCIVCFSNLVWFILSFVGGVINILICRM